MESNGNATKKDLQELENRMDHRFEIVGNRLGNVEGRLGNVEGRLGNVEDRLGHVDNQLGHMANRLQEMDNHLNGIDGRFKDMETRIVDRLTELVRDVETNLLTSFHGYGKGQSARMHLLEVSDSATSQRLAALEERVLNLETRRGPGAH